MPARPAYQSAYDVLGTHITPGDVLDFHRKSFGDLLMMADDDNDDAPDDNDGDAPSDAGTDTPDDGEDDLDGVDLAAEDRAKVQDVLRKQREELAKERSRRTAAEKLTAATEKRRKEAAAEADRLRQANESETDKKIREARDQGRAEAVTGTAKSMLRMALRVQGVKDADLDDAVDDFNLTAAVVDGEIDENRITRYAERFAPKKKATTEDVGGGRGGAPVKPTSVNAVRDAVIAASAK